MSPVRYFNAIPEVGANVLRLGAEESIISKPASYILSKNVRRRHLTSEQKRAANRRVHRIGTAKEQP